jgi:hypothetical protein
MVTGKISKHFAPGIGLGQKYSAIVKGLALVSNPTEKISFGGKDIPLEINGRPPRVLLL